MGRPKVWTKLIWNDKSSVIVSRKGFGTKLNKELAINLKEHSDKYMPRITGNMTRGYRIQSSKSNALIVYLSKYARFQFENESYNHHHTWRPLQINPLATHHWTDFCWSQPSEQRAIIRKTNAYRKEISK